MTSQSNPTITCFIHSNSPVPDRRRAIQSTLEALADMDAIDSYTVEQWPAMLSLDACSDRWQADAATTFEQLDEWAEREGVSIRPPFAVRTTKWAVTGEEDLTLHTPHIGLTVESGDEIEAFYPHVGEEGVVTVTDGLDRLAHRVESESTETTPTPNAPNP